MSYTADYDWVEQVPLSQFSNKALIIASRFARVLRSLNGQQIQLQDQQLARKIIHQVEENKDPKLRSLFDELVSELYAFAETRDQARYRGALKTTSDTSSMAESVAGESEKVVKYRGVAVVSDKKAIANKATANKGKKTFYRGVEVEE